MYYNERHSERWACGDSEPKLTKYSHMTLCIRTVYVHVLNKIVYLYLSTDHTSHDTRPIRRVPSQRRRQPNRPSQTQEMRVRLHWWRNMRENACQLHTKAGWWLQMDVKHKSAHVQGDGRTRREKIVVLKLESDCWQVYLGYSGCWNCTQHYNLEHVHWFHCARYLFSELKIAQIP